MSPLDGAGRGGAATYLGRRLRQEARRVDDALGLGLGERGVIQVDDPFWVLGMSLSHGAVVRADVVVSFGAVGSCEAGACGWDIDRRELLPSARCGAVLAQRTVDLAPAFPTHPIELVISSHQ